MKKFIQIIAAALFILNLNSAKAQQCGTFEYESYLNAKFPGYSNALEQTRKESIREINRLNKAGNDTVYMIPVVFHVVWNTPEQNIHDSLIFSQVKTLNESFRHVHKDTGNIRNIFKPVAGDTKIEFYLATEDPNGIPTNGIDRVQTAKTDFGESNLFAEGVKTSATLGADAWNTEKYLNIWICKFTYKGNMYVTAYGFPPTNAQFWSSNNFTSANLQGVVVNYQFVGVQNPYNVSAGSLKERTLVHEVGHFLGLRHIWADKQNTCFGQDDGIKDTPLARSANTVCVGNNSCAETTDDKPDMTENYMDYSAYPCTMMFTKQQTDLMRFNLLNLRSTLYQLKVNIAPTPLPLYTKISISPNPVKEDMKIVFDKKGDYEMSVIDIVGQKVADEKFTVGDNYEYIVPLHLGAGYYYVNVKADNNVILKQRILVQ